MAQVEVILPKMGESVTEAIITKWLKVEGDTIESEESLVEIATDKVDSEIPSPADGVIAKILVQEGEIAQAGQAIAIITGEGEELNTGNGTGSETVVIETPAQIGEKIVAEPVMQSVVTNPVIPVAVTTIPKMTGSGRFYSPLVRNIAKAEGISLEELETVPGTGKNSRVTKKDILAYIPTRNGQQAATGKSTATPSTLQQITPKQSVQATTPVSGTTEIIEMDRMRKLIAGHMVLSKHTSPHVTSFVEADVTNLVNWRNKIKQAFEQREGQKITFTPLFIEAAVKALNDFPMVNVSIDGDNIIKKNFINVGIATALPSGNLIVPVIKNADMLNLIGLTKTVNDLIARARDNKLEPDEIHDGTFTITNLGTFGSVMGTPIINQPQAAILATGIIQKKPVVIETEHGDFIGIRHMIFLSLSYDHRIVDGALGGRYLRKVADYLEQFDHTREI